MSIEPQHWPVLSRLLDQVLDVPPAQRLAWVDQLQGDDAAYAAQLRQMLLAQSHNLDATADPLETLPKFSGTALHGHWDEPSVPGQTGQQIGPYRLLHLLGKGGMGAVWFAERSDGLVKRNVALKLPLAQHFGPLAARFARERDILASLEHAHIARLYDAGVAQDGQPYLALEYVQGVAISDYCDHHQLSPSQRLTLFLQVLDAVQYAHSRLVIHRDLKPSNILVGPDGVVHLLDFGVAKLLADPEAPQQDMTELTQVAGTAITLSYAAPEQLNGQPISTATDVYALGVVLYELLTGARPYRTARDSRAALEEAILDGNIIAPSGAAITPEVAQARGLSPAGLRQALRGDLDAIVLKAMQGDVALRYGSASALADDLERHLAGYTVRAQGHSRRYWLGKYLRRNKLGVASAVAVLLSLITGLAVALWQARQASAQAQIAAQERDKALAAVEHREAVESFMSDLLLEAGRIGKPISIPELIDRADKLSAKEFANNPDARGAVLKLVGEYQGNFQGPGKALEFYEQAHQVLAHSSDLGLKAVVECDRALYMGVTGSPVAARELLTRWATDSQTPGVAALTCYDDLTQLALYHRDYDQAEKALDSADALLAKLPENRPDLRVDLDIYRAQIVVAKGRPAVAQRILRQVLVDLTTAGRANGEKADSVAIELADASRYAGQPLVALQIFQGQLQKYARDAGGVPPPAQAIYAVANALFEAGNLASAVTQAKRAQRLSKQQGDSVIEADAYLCAAKALVQSGRLDEAHQMLVAAEQVGRRALGSNAAWASQLSRVKGLLSLKARQVEAALDAYNFALAKAQSGNAAAKFTLLRERAAVHLARADWLSANADARQALDYFEAARGDNRYSAAVGRSLVVLGQIAAAQGDPATSDAAFGQAVQHLSQTVDARSPDLITAKTALSKPNNERHNDAFAMKQ